MNPRHNPARKSLNVLICLLLVWCFAPEVTVSQESEVETFTRLGADVEVFPDELVVVGKRGANVYHVTIGSSWKAEDLSILTKSKRITFIKLEQGLKFENLLRSIEGMKSLRQIELQLGDVPFVDLTLLAKCDALYHISLEGSSIDPKMLNGLTACKNLTSLCLGNSNIDDSIGGLLHQLGSLDALVLSDSNVTGTILEKLPEGLGSLSLKNIDVSDKHIHFLFRFHRLRIVDLRGTSVSIAAIESLQNYSSAKPYVLK